LYNIIVSSKGCYSTNELNNNNMNLNNIYTELQQIDEFHANFNPTDASRKRMRELIEMIPISKYDRVR